ncbi:fibrillin-2 [Lingula anatina]|uniref:Fibrillin-2 n=1 Tax=Lingula anatina TaxID=7574 RepID=A0A2R2MTX6_LINAN|nr:fibrillin-2 [Lingula anatina]|eukprot:XP_023933583.1 fibrillin-2 [Lingula anatina]
MPKCPPGTYSSSHGLSSENECLPCPGGFYCFKHGATGYDPLANISQSGVAMCEAGYYCKSGASSGTPTPDISTGQGGPCPTGHYCPIQTEDPVPCPSGTYRDTPLAKAVLDCVQCPLGMYCARTNLSHPQGPCDPGFYCLIGSNTSSPTGEDPTQGAPCPVGNYCSGGTSTPLNCPSGTYNNLTGQSTCLTCPEGFYCPENLTSYEEYLCPVGHYCPEGTGHAYEYKCPKGYFRNTTMGEKLADCSPCPGGYYCAGEGLTGPTGLCSAGYFCVRAAWSSEPSDYDNYTTGDCLCPSTVTGGECQPGYYCPQGSWEPISCPGGKYCARPGLSEVTGSCRAGHYCVLAASRPDPIDGVTGNICPTGHYCPNGTSVHQPSCPVGTYSNRTGLQTIAECMPCLQGYYCDTEGLSTPGSLCDPGYYCRSGQNSSDLHHCSPGHFCPLGSYEEQECPSGQYQDLYAQGSCKACRPGFYCDATYGPVSNFSSYSCPPGYYCVSGTEWSTQYPCPAEFQIPLYKLLGTYNPHSNLESAEQCISCDAGKYCGTPGRNNTEGECLEGYWCKSAATSPTPTDGSTGMPCPRGHYCPRGTPGPIPCPMGYWSNSTGRSRLEDCQPCTAGHYCNQTGLSVPSGLCDAGYFCVTLVTMATPNYGVHKGDICPPGHYCPEPGTVSPIPCPVGFYASSNGSVKCEVCPVGHYCVDGVEPVTCPPRFYCAVGTGYVHRSCANYIDECVKGGQNCIDSSAQCSGTGEDFECSCKSGYTGDGFACIDIDECLVDRGGCDKNADCINMLSNHSCVCKVGYSGDGFTCVEINECSVNNGGCASDATCTNTEGSFICTCHPGYAGNGFTCEDINECAVNNGGCAADADCTNTLGNFTCTCHTGFTGDGIVCDDINECLFNDSCHASALCNNSAGSFSCSCLDGFSGDGFYCEDINECSVDDGGCDENAICANSIGSFTCSCNVFFSGDGFSCLDISQCYRGNITCDDNAMCVDTGDSLDCVCNTGFLGDGYSCHDIDECLENNGGCDSDATCTNTAGSFICTCHMGYTGDGLTCQDTNECLVDNGGCSPHALCTNTLASFTCACHEGFLGDGFICEDIDECTSYIDSCDVNANCTNTVGNFTCTCHPGYTGDGHTCIACTGIGVHPPLDLSNQIIHFRATALTDVSTATIHVINSHTSMNEYTHPVPRIGKGAIAPVGPTSFEFVVPEGAPLTVSPAVGTVEPGKSCCVRVRYTPSLPDSVVRKEAVRMAVRELQAKAEKEYQEELQREKENQEQAAKRKKKGPAGKGKPSPKGKPKGGAPLMGETVPSGPAPVKAPPPESIDTKSDAYAQAQASLLRTFKSEFNSYVIPCYVASGKTGNPGELPYSIHNTLYLEVHCPTVKPPLVVISDNGRTTVDFGDVSIGQTVIKTATIQNIFEDNINVTASLLDPVGPFVLLNALRELEPEESLTVIFSFTPGTGRVYQEVQELRTGISTLYLNLVGQGVSPKVSLSLDTDHLDMGAVLENEYVEKTFKIKNTSTLAIDFSIKMDSNSLLRHALTQGIPQFVRRDQTQKVKVGVQNFNGQRVFDCVPCEGTIAPGSSTEIMMTYAPDHASVNYFDTVRIQLFGMEEQHSFQVLGQCFPHIMYVAGGDELMPDVESLTVLPGTEEEEEVKSSAIPVLLTFNSVSSEEGFSAASRELLVGCVRTMAVSQKKPGKQNGEFSFENTKDIEAKGFTLDPPKGQVEAGSKRPVQFTWNPPAGHDMM